MSAPSHKVTIRLRYTEQGVPWKWVGVCACGWRCMSWHWHWRGRGALPMSIEHLQGVEAMVDRESQVDALASTFGISRAEAEGMIDEGHERRQERIAFLLDDIESDERMSGVPRYRHRYDKAHRDLADEVRRLRRGV